MRLCGLIKSHYRFYVVWVVWAFILGCLPSVGTALPVSSRGVKTLDSLNRSEEILKISSLLDEGGVKNRLVKLGLKPEEVKAKLATLNDEDLSRLSAQVDKIQAGGSGAGIFLALIFFLLLIWAILYLVEHEVTIDVSSKKKEKTEESK